MFIQWVLILHYEMADVWSFWGWGVNWCVGVTVALENRSNIAFQKRMSIVQTSQRLINSPPSTWRSWFPSFCKHEFSWLHALLLLCLTQFAANFIPVEGLVIRVWTCERAGFYVRAIFCNTQWLRVISWLGTLLICWKIGTLLNIKREIMLSSCRSFNSNRGPFI